MLYDQAQLSVVYSQAFQVTLSPNLNPGYQSQSLPGNCGFLLISTHNSLSHPGYLGFPPLTFLGDYPLLNLSHPSDFYLQPPIPCRSLVMNSILMWPKASCSM